MILPSLPSLPPSVYVAGVVSFVVAFMLVVTKRWHGRFSMDDLKGVQKMHLSPTPRIGGVAVFIGATAAWLVASPEKSELIGVLLLAGTPAFAFGLIEDVTKRVSVLARLLATMASGVLGWWLTDASITRVDVPLLDLALQYTVVSVAFTAFAVGGVANAINIIDGFNGQASGFIVIALVGLALVSGVVGDVGLGLVCLAIAASMFGFWLINWPWGKLFLGDGGSYFGGFALAWISVLLIQRNDDVTAFVPLLICIHPVTEVLFSIYRRRITHASPGAPDRMHLHSLIMGRVVSPRLRRMYKDEPEPARLMRNPVTGFVVAMMSLPAVVLALVSVHSPLFASLSCLALALGYVALYARIVRFRWCSPIDFLLKKPRVSEALRPVVKRVSRS